MVSAQLIQKVKDILDHIKEPFVLTEAVKIPAGRDYVVDTYLSLYLGLPEAAKERLIDQMYAGWKAWGNKKGFGNREVRAWGRATIGAAYLFCFTDPDELKQMGKMDFAADVLVRVSRWFQTEGPTWKAMRPHATELVKQVWGNIEDLRRMEAVCENARAEGAVRTRSGFRFKWLAKQPDEALDFASLLS